MHDDNSRSDVRSARLWLHVQNMQRCTEMLFLIIIDDDIRQDKTIDLWPIKRRTCPNAWDDNRINTNERFFLCVNKCSSR